METRKVADCIMLANWGYARTLVARRCRIMADCEGVAVSWMQEEHAGEILAQAWDILPRCLARARSARHAVALAVLHAARRSAKGVRIAQDYPERQLEPMVDLGRYGLTDQQRRCLELIGEGWSYAAIGAILDCSRQAAQQLARRGGERIRSAR